MPSSHLCRNGSQSKFSPPPSPVRVNTETGLYGRRRGGRAKSFPACFDVDCAHTRARGVRSGQVAEGGYLHACWGRRPAGHQGVYYLTTEYPSAEFNYYARIYVHTYIRVYVYHSSRHIGLTLCPLLLPLPPPRWTSRYHSAAGINIINNKKKTNMVVKHYSVRSSKRTTGRRVKLSEKNT